MVIKLGTMDSNLEKGKPDGCREDRNRISTLVWSAGYYKIVVFLFVATLLLWQYGLLTFSLPPPLAQHVQGIPDYILEYAPMVWLDEKEQYFPSDINAQVENTHPAVNFTPVENAPTNLTLHNLDALNAYGNNGRNVFLTSNIDITESPKWLDGIVPNSAGETKNAISCVVIVNDHGEGLVDAFYMYFYAYNMGNTVFFQELGDHIGDWEHNMVRFQDGNPMEIWYSQHGNGEAFRYSVLEKIGKRPVSYSARGSHANYATKGTHDHTIPDFNLPIGPLEDYCSQGTLWDPTLSSYFYIFNGTTNSFTNADGRSPVEAMYFRGKWGDEQYPMSDKRQKDFFGFKKYVGGPTGPWDKQLNRSKVCPENGITCIVRDALGP